MTEIVHSALPDYLKKTSAKACPSVWLIHGQEVLVEKAGEALSRHLLGEEARETSYSSIDGFAQNIPDLLAELNTFALLAAVKVVMFKDARIFDTQGAQQRLIVQIEEAWENRQTAQAAKALLNLCDRLGIELEEVTQQYERHADLKALFESLGKEAMIQLVNYCNDQGWSPAAADNQVEILQQAIEKGFPEGHFLLITANSKVPKNLKFYKTIAANGVVVDCSVPQGERRMDKEAQQAVLRQTLDSMLKKAGKRMAPALFKDLVELTGFDLRVFIQNIEKLINYAGQRNEITLEDIHYLLRRTKSDPLFQLTNAVADRDVRQALFFTHSLLTAQWHALQLLAALANQIRKLLVAKDFAGGSFGQNWSAGLAYAQFQQNVMPAIQAYDEHVGSQTIPWPGSRTNKKGKGVKDATRDLRLAPNPKNAFPVYQTMLKSEKFARQELLQAMTLLNEADLRLKSTGQDPFIVMKKLVVEICRKN